MTQENPSTQYDKSLDAKKAFRYCIHLLAKQNYSKFKLSQKLRSKKYQQTVVSECIEKLLNLEYLNEEEYTRVKIRSLGKKGYGVKYIIQKCQQENLVVDEFQIEDVFKQENLKEDSILQYQVEKKIRNLQIDSMPYELKYKMQQKITRSLLTRGFSYDLIQKYLASHFL